MICRVWCHLCKAIILHNNAIQYYGTPKQVVVKRKNLHEKDKCQMTDSNYHQEWREGNRIQKGHIGVSALSAVFNFTKEKMWSKYGSMSTSDKAWGHHCAFCFDLCTSRCPFIQNEYLACAKHCFKNQGQSRTHQPRRLYIRECLRYFLFFKGRSRAREK